MLGARAVQHRYARLIRGISLDRGVVAGILNTRRVTNRTHLPAELVRLHHQRVVVGVSDLVIGAGWRRRPHDTTRLEGKWRVLALIRVTGRLGTPAAKHTLTILTIAAVGLMLLHHSETLEVATALAILKRLLVVLEHVLLRVVLTQDTAGRVHLVRAIRST